MSHGMNGRLEETQNPDTLELKRSKKPILFFIIPEYGRRNMTMKCVNSIARSKRFTRAEIVYIIVGDDNYHKNIKFGHGVLYNKKLPIGIELRFDKRVNYAENVNRMVRWCQPQDKDILFIVNNDIEFYLNTIPVMAEHVYNRQECIVGPALIENKAGSHVQIFDKNTWEDLKPKNKIINMTSLSGCCFALSAKTWNTLGGFDSENFVAFFEDDDLCIRANLAGYKVIADLAIRVEHFRGATMRQYQNLDRELMPVSRAKFEQKWGPEIWDPTGRYKLPGNIADDDPRIFNHGKTTDNPE